MNNEDEIFVTSSKQNGIKYGYPDCCIKAFVSQAPSVMRGKKPTENDLLRFEMSHVNGQYSGFIPCLRCATLIKLGKITLESLINKERRIVPTPFPNDWSLA